MAKGASKSRGSGCWKTRRSQVNTCELELALCWEEPRVLEIQAKLHRWAVADPGRRFDDLFNLVADPAFLLVAWARVRGNRGARTAGVDGHTALSITAAVGVEGFLDRLRASLKDRSFRPLPVRERMIPKAGGKKRRLGIATIADRVVQASLKLVLEPIFEADFLPCSYGFRPKRRAHDAVAEVRFLTSRSFQWVVEGDIKACLNAWSHCSFADCHDQNSWSWGLGSSIRRPFMRPVRVRTARSSPRFTRCNMVWREMPRARVAWWMATQPSGVSSVSMPRNCSVSRMRQGAPGVTCSPATKPSLSQRSKVEGAICSWRAAWLTLSSSPSSWPAPGWWQGMCQWVRSEATLLAVNDSPRAVVRCCRLRIPAITASGQCTARRRIR